MILPVSVVKRAEKMGSPCVGKIIDTNLDGRRYISHSVNESSPRGHRQR